VKYFINYTVEYNDAVGLHVLVRAIKYSGTLLQRCYCCDT